MAQARIIIYNRTSAVTCKVRDKHGVMKMSFVFTKIGWKSFLLWQERMAQMLEHHGRSTILGFHFENHGCMPTLATIATNRRDWTRVYPNDRDNDRHSWSSTIAMHVSIWSPSKKLLFFRRLAIRRLNGNRALVCAVGPGRSASEEFQILTILRLFHLHSSP